MQRQGNVRIMDNRAADWNRHVGWLVDLPAAGERLVSDLVLRHRRLVFTSFIPSLGGGWLNELNAPNGGRLPFTLLDLDSDGFYTLEDHTTLNPDDDAPACCIRSPAGGYVGAPAVLVNGATEMQLVSEAAGTVAQWVKNPGPRVVGRQSWEHVLLP